MHQPELFGRPRVDRLGTPHRGRLDAASEDLLQAYRQARVAEGASPSATATEVSQLRSLVHASALVDGPATLAALLGAPVRLAQLLVTPPAPISRSCGRSRLLAIQRFWRLLHSTLGWNVVDLTAELDGELPRSAARDWFATHLVVGGDLRQRRSPTPTLSPALLMRHAAILALLCFSGLRMQDLAVLTWDDLIAVILPSGQVGQAIRLVRRGTLVQLLLLDPAMEALRAWEAFRKAEGFRSGAVFCALPGPSRPLGYQSLRRIVRAACCAVGLPPEVASDLRSTFAYWLHCNGFTPHQIAALLGVAHVRTVDALLRGHLALDAQRRARSALIP